ncbi:hypothetical protein KKA66_03885 [Patescibacteria group bacterium]|nr:hypothetical protein [Patescibacteria group bacterium]
MILKKNKIYTLILIFIFSILFIFRLNNAINYNCYWGYDGAKHIEYIDSIEDKLRLPSFNENYLAWHAPFYYFALAIPVKIYHAFNIDADFFTRINFLQILSAFLDILFLYIFYKTLKLLTKNKFVQLSTLLGVGFFTPLIMVNNYLTNEIGLFWLTILIFYFLVKIESPLLFKEGSRGWLIKKRGRDTNTGWNYKKAFWLGILLALALLTKLSALILILAILIWLLYKAIYLKNKKFIYYVLIIFFVIFCLNLPWQIYRAQNFGQALTINNYENIKQTELKQKPDISKKFFLNFDFNIFNNPFWQSGRNSMWSMVYAQLFVDYDNIGGNVDLNNLQKQIQTGNFRFVNLEKFQYSILMLYFGVLMFLIFIFGYLKQIYNWIKNKFKPDINFFLLVFITGSLVALIYNVIQYPFIERGTLKVIFILSAWPWLFYLGFKNLAQILEKYKLKFLYSIIFILLISYAFLSLKINWVSQF